jgi:4-oxalocrotonate tautomerase
MPFANFRIPQGLITTEQKADILHTTTDMFVRLYGEGVRPYTMVLVEEVAEDGYSRADEIFDLADAAVWGHPPAAWTDLPTRKAQFTGSE